MADSRIINIGGNNIGIAGLDAAIDEMTADFAGRDDGSVGEEMLKRLSGRNYIPPNARERYAAGFVREFRRKLGQPFEPEKRRGLEIRVLGPGCAQCDQLDGLLRAVLAETKLVADLEHVRDIKEIAAYGAMAVPALVVNGKMVSVGKVPAREKIKEWLIAAENETSSACSQGKD